MFETVSGTGLAKLTRQSAGTDWQPAGLKLCSSVLTPLNTVTVLFLAFNSAFILTELALCV